MLKQRLGLLSCASAYQRQLGLICARQVQGRAAGDAVAHLLLLHQADGAGDGQRPGDDEGARGDQRALAEPAIRAGLVEDAALTDGAQVDGEVLVHADPLGRVGVGGAALDDVVAVGGGEELCGEAFAGHHDGFDGMGQVGDGAAFGEIHDLLLHGEILLFCFDPL